MAIQLRSILGVLYWICCGQFQSSPLVVCRLQTSTCRDVSTDAYQDELGGVVVHYATLTSVLRKEDMDQEYLPIVV